MGRIIEALGKLKLNGNVSDKPFNKMTAKELISLLYHLAEVYDAEALLPETTVKKKLQVFKSFARLHSLIHLLPPVKEMKNPKKCTRLVNNLLDMLEDKYGDGLYTRSSWPVACKELPKIENAFSASQYDIESLKLSPDAVPPGTTKGANKSIESPEESESKHVDDGALTTDDNISKVIETTKASSVVSKAVELPTVPLSTISDGTEDVTTAQLTPTAKISESKNKRQEGEPMSLSKENPVEHSNKKGLNLVENTTNISKTTKRKLEPSLTSPESKERQKKLKTEHSACEQFIEALEDLSKVRLVVEVIGWSKAIFTNHRIWLTIREVIFARVLLGKELRKYQAKKVPTAAGTIVIVEKSVSEEDMKMLRLKLRKIMDQIKNLVPEELSEKLKSAVNSSCENVQLRIRDMNDW